MKKQKHEEHENMKKHEEQNGVNLWKHKNIKTPECASPLKEWTIVYAINPPLSRSEPSLWNEPPLLMS